MTIASIGYDQSDILRSIQELHCPNGFDVDLTYGNGAFWKNATRPQWCFDIDPQAPEVVEACSTNVPLPDQSVSSVVFDPPFLTYVRAGREGNGGMIMARRFAGYWRYDELETHYKNTLAEAKRILKNKGVLVFKCQDIVHNHRLHCTHANVIQWASAYGFRLLDIFILLAKHRLPSPNRAGKQRHARIFHSYFIVLVSE